MAWISSRRFPDPVVGASLITLATFGLRGVRNPDAFPDRDKSGCCGNETMLGQGSRAQSSLS